MKFIIRDDDLNFYTEISAIKKTYSFCIKNSIPVSFAAIPFVNSDSDVAHSVDKMNIIRCISRNNELCQYINENDFFYINLHGSLHNKPNGIFECDDAISNSLIYSRLRRADAILKSTFKNYKPVFIPPHDALGDRSRFAISKLSLHTIKGSGSKYLNLKSFKDVYAFICSCCFGLNRFVTGNRNDVYPRVLSWDHGQEAYAYRLTDFNRNFLIKKLHISAKKNRDFIVTMHIHHNTDARISSLIEFINLADKYGYEFTDSSKIFQ